MKTWDDPEFFESEVRRIARLRFRTSFGGAEKEEGQERDGVFVTEDFVHIVEATTSRKKDKAEQDVGKIHKLTLSMRIKHPRKAVRGWFITADDPTADQRAVLRDAKYHGIEAISYHQFIAEIVDGREYISLRENYPFGSAKNPSTQNYRLDDSGLIPTNFFDASGLVRTTEELLTQGLQRIVLIGEFGSGKSVALKELYNALRAPYINNESLSFPLMLNLRDHIGQRDPVEALERHARNVGYSNPSHFVRAWRAGLVHLLLDGFDEVSTFVWGSSAKQLRPLRRQSMQLVRAFVENSPPEVVVVLAGREHFFDSRREMLDALGMKTAQVLELREFDDTQLARYLAAINRAGRVLPEWFPTRPLLLSYLLSRELFEEVRSGESSAAHGWDALLDRVCERECLLEPGLDGATLRLLVERLATACRASADGVGPVTQSAIVLTFEEVCGYPPTEASLTLVQRLPGLGIANVEDGSRVFVNRDLAATAAAGDVARFVREPYLREVAEHVLGLQNSLPRLGIEVCVAQTANEDPGKIRAAIERTRMLEKASALQCDLVRVAMHIDGPSMPSSLPIIAGVLIPELEITSEHDLGGLHLAECVVEQLVLDRNIPDAWIPTFSGCLIGVVEGRFGYSDLPHGHFQDCDIESFGESNETSSAILEAELPMAVRVLLVCLRKLYLQKGTGRKESAFVRGIDHRGRPYVPRILALLKRYEIAIPWRSGPDTVWLPTKSGRSAAGRMIANPSDRVVPVVAEVWDMD